MNPVLERVIAREGMREILACLTPAEVAMLAWLLDGYNVSDVAEIMGISQAAVSQGLRRAEDRLLQELPYLAAQGRRGGSKGYYYRKANGNGRQKQ